MTRAPQLNDGRLARRGRPVELKCELGGMLGAAHARPPALGVS